MFKSIYRRYYIASVILGILLVSFVSAPLSVLLHSVRAESPWKPGWQHRKSITINHALVGAGGLVNFPVLIDITDSNLSSHAQADGDDIYFTDSNGAQLSHEIEFYNSGHLVAWVKVPSLSSSVDTVLYMYYGNVAAENQENPSGVWDSNFMMVQHLSETSGTHYDSTVNGNNGSPQGGVVQGTTGKIDGADNFDGTKNYVTVPHSSTITGFTEAFTVEAWIKLDTTSRRQVILNKWNIASNQRGWFLEYHNTNRLGFFVSQNGGSVYPYYYANGFIPTVGAWYHIVVVWRSGQPAVFYVNGAQISTTTSTGTVTEIYNNPSAPLDIGRSTYATDNRYFGGAIDEVRVSNPARSAEWISTCYYNQVNPSNFYAVGPEVSPGAPIVSDPYPLDGAINVPISLPGLSFYLEDPDDALMNFSVTTSPPIGDGGLTNRENGTYYLPVFGLAYNTSYTWHVDVTDGVSWTNVSYTFTTVPEPVPPTPPEVSDPYPPDSATDVPISLDELGVIILDPNGDLMNITATTDPDIGSSNATGIPDTPFTIPVSGLNYETTYTWHVNVTDGTFWTNMTYHFTTESEPEIKFKALTINHTLVVGNLVNFPVLIDITDSDLASDAQPDGSDIYFTNSSGVQLSHEIEFYSAGHLVAWVRVPSLSSLVDTTLYMCYGDPGAGDPENPAAVWDANFMMVQHLNEVSGDIYDSTVNGNNGTAVNGVVRNADGNIDGADSFDGTDDYVTILDSNTLAGFTQFTASFWIKMDVTTGRRTILNKWNIGSGQRAWYIDYDPSRGTNTLGLFVSADGSAYSYWYASFSPVAGNWYHIAIVWQSGVQTLFYVNGSAVTVTTSTARASVCNNAEPLYIGRSYTTGRYFDGVIDEVRISNVARSAQWIATCYNTQMNPRAIGPKVVSHVPSVGATGVSRTTTINVTFSEPMNRSLTEAAFSINGSVSGTFSWNLGNTTMTFTPNSPLAYSTGYNVTITTAAKSMQGQNMLSTYSWNFTTEQEPSTTWPYVVSHVPGISATGVPVATTIVVNFSEPMDQASAQSAFSINGSVSGSLNWLNASAMMFTPASPLSYLAGYSVTISTAARDLEGQNMTAPYSWSFTTEQRPTVISTVPPSNEVNVPLTTTVQVTFSEPMDRISTQGAFSINGSVAGVFSWNPGNTTLTFTPSSSLANSTVYNVTLTSAAKSVEGDGLMPYSWIFTTVATGTAPYVKAVTPAVDALDVSQYTTIYINFSEPMDTASTQSALRINSSAAQGYFGWLNANSTMVFKPYYPLMPNAATYNVTITTAAKDAQSEYMTTPYSWTFKTEYSTKPYVTAVVPAPDAKPPSTNVSLMTTIRVTFSEAMDHASAENGFSISPSVGSGPHKYEWGSGDTRMTVTLNSTLAPNTTYTVTISVLAKDLQDEHVAALYSWNFTTPPERRPYVVSTTPAPGEQNVTYTIWGANFSEAMSGDLTEAAFSINVTGTIGVNFYIDFRWVNSSYVEFYLAPLNSFRGYNVTISTSAVSAQGMNLTQYSWNFTTGNVTSTSTQKWTATIPSGQGSGESSPLIADITSDVGEEVVYVGTDYVRCLNGRNGTTIWTYNDGAIGWNVQPQMGDIDNDGQFEIVIPLYSPTGILVLNTDNTRTGTAARSLYWKRTGIGGSSYTSKPLLVDPDGDGYWMAFCAPEDVRGYGYTSTYTSRIWAFNYDGREINNGLWGTANDSRTATNGYNAALSSARYQWFAWRPCSGGFSMADTDNNGLFELYQNDRDMYYSDGGYAKGTICWEWSPTTQNLTLKWYQPDMLVSSHTPILVDINKDGVLDVIAAHMRGGLAVFNSTTGAEIKKDYNVGLPSHYQPVVYDIDRDGNPEILLADGDHPGNSPPDIVIFDLYTWKIEARMYVGPCKFAPTVAEVTGDGIMDIVAVSNNGVFIFDGSHDPSVDKTYPVQVVATGLPYQCLYAVVQDIDNDGLNEIVVASSGYRVYAYDTPAPRAALRPRSEVQYYNERRTGVAEYVPPVFYDRKTPIVSNPYPSNEAANVTVTLPPLRFNITDLQGDKMNFTVTTTIPVDAADLTGQNRSNGMYSVDVTSAIQYHKKYTWSVSVTDGVNWNNKTYTFTTLDGAPTGSPPTQIAPVLNSSGIGAYENATSVNLICTNQTVLDPDGDKVTNIYRWLRNGQSIANVVMPFDTDSLTTAKDYSGYNNNGQIHGATWTSNGKIGGAYSFDGLDDYMVIPDGGAGYYNGRIYTSTLGGGGNSGNWSEMTVEMWINLAALSTKESTRILMKIPSYEIGLGSIGGSSQTANRLTAAVWLDNPASGDNAGPPDSDPKETEYMSARAPTSQPLNVNTWYHVAFTYKDGKGVVNSVLTLYINGVAVTTSSSLTTRGPIKASSGEPLYIGWFDYFNGMIDEARIYSRCLSTEQISQRYNETKDGLTRSSTLAHTETKTGETWTCQVIPNDSHQDGNASTSNPLLILPGPQVPPVVNNVRVLGQTSMSTSRVWSNETIVAIYSYSDANDDPEVFGGSYGTQIRWYRNGTWMPALDNLTSLSTSITAAHEDWTFQIKPGDGYTVAAEWVNASNKVIVNSPPVVTSYSPEYGYSLSHILMNIGGTQTFSFTYSEMDGDPVSIEWQVDGVTVAANVTSFTWTATAIGSFTIRTRIYDTGYGSTYTTQSWSIVVR